MYELSERSIAILAASIVIGICVAPVVLKMVNVVGDDFHERFGEGYKYLGYFIGMLFAGAFVYIVLFFFLKLFLKIIRI
jgi:hypothetical protein